MTRVTVYRATGDALLKLRTVIENDHYLHRWPDPRSLPFAYGVDIDDKRFAADGRPLGVVVMKKPQHHRQTNLFGYPGLPTAWQVLDLARVWIHPDLQGQYTSGRNRKGEPVMHATCIFSQMVARVIRRIQRDWLIHHPPRYPDKPYHIRLILSYCELAHHDGTGYRASGFRSISVSSDGSKEVYVRHLKFPHWSWMPETIYQPPLLPGMPLGYPT